jgi:hypothetical protein
MASVMAMIRYLMGLALWARRNVGGKLMKNKFCIFRFFSSVRKFLFLYVSSPPVAEVTRPLLTQRPRSFVRLTAVRIPLIVPYIVDISHASAQCRSWFTREAASRLPRSRRDT